jgi:hypothetical protein
MKLFLKPPLSQFVFVAIHFAVLTGLAGAEHTFTAEEKSWWAVQPVREVVVPGEVEQVVDYFVERKLQEAELKMAPGASAEEFVRRAYFDLIGLPPSTEEVEAFSKAWAEDEDASVTKLVDELLASPRYGERWATHWLDVVRFAESDGYRADDFRPGAHLYRDYVVKAFNEDKPYDEFVREQLAADEIAPDDPERMAATGFLRHGVYEWNQRNAEMQREIMINEITNVTGEVFLGMGVGCAQCHDHKFDPILQKDYFALQAFLSSTIWADDRYYASREEIASYEAKLKIWEEATAEIRAEMESLVAKRQQATYDFRVKTFPPEVQEIFSKPREERTSYDEQIVWLVNRQAEREVRLNAKPEQVLKKESPERIRYDEMKEELAKFADLKPQEPKRAFVTTDTGAKEATVTIPGKKEVIEPQFFELLGGEMPKIEVRENTTGRRSALAEWIVREDNPLTARVMVNRIWQHHFGRGLAASPNDFGMLGEAPTHPGLLDWLARKFVKGGWKMKPMHRFIMTSRAYRQTARYEPSSAENIKDPDNKLLWRYPPRRLSAEQVRDAMLALSGELKHRGGGASQENGSPVRSLYIKKLRNTPNQTLQCFDAPAGFASEPARFNTTTPTQSLLLVNGEWPLARARAMAKRLSAGGEAGAKEVAGAYRQAWGRKASDEEVEGGVQFLKEQIKLIGKAELTDPEAGQKSPLIPLAGGFKEAGNLLPESVKSALALVPGRDRLKLGGLNFEDDHFTVSGVVKLDKIHGDGRVNTLISQWDGNQQNPGWSLGVTSEKSRYQPRNLIIQLVGDNPGGDVEYEVVASGLRVPLGRAVFLAAAVNPQPDGKGTVTFYLKDLGETNAVMQSVVVEHNIASLNRGDDLSMVVGGRMGPGSHRWQGEIARLTVVPTVLEQAMVMSNEGAVVDLLFDEEVDGVPFPKSSWMDPKKPKETLSPSSEAFADFCHALLSSNEFLYLH